MGTGEGAREIETGTELGRGQAEHSQGKLVMLEGTVPLGSLADSLVKPTVIQV